MNIGLAEFVFNTLVNHQESYVDVFLDEVFKQKDYLYDKQIFEYFDCLAKKYNVVVFLHNAKINRDDFADVVEIGLKNETNYIGIRFQFNHQNKNTITKAVVYGKDEESAIIDKSILASHFNITAFEPMLWVLNNLLTNNN